MDKKGNTLTLEEWKDLGRQISELLDLTWKCAHAKAEIKTLELRSWYIDKVEMFAETGEMFWELDEKLQQIAKQLKPPLDRHAIWEGIKPHVEPKLQETYEKTFKEHRGRGFDRVAKILQYVEKLGFPKEAKERIPKKLGKEF
ncbi:MAG TPA: hypothetical protein VHT73_19220 [Thermodesulfobacteriota bacterium]|nr:hypothetical protein [Thermodesulfobacteriota bacterium]